LLIDSVALLLSDSVGDSLALLLIDGAADLLIGCLAVLLIDSFSDCSTLLLLTTSALLLKVDSALGVRHLLALLVGDNLANLLIDLGALPLRCCLANLFIDSVCDCLAFLLLTSTALLLKSDRAFPIIDSVALLFILNGADLFLNSGALLFSSGAALFVILGLLDGGTLLLRHLATVGGVAHTALGVGHSLTLLSVGHITDLVLDCLTFIFIDSGALVLIFGSADRGGCSSIAR